MLPHSSQVIIYVQGSVVRVEDDEFWHMAKVLRLGLNTRFFFLFNFHTLDLKHHAKREMI